MLNSLTLTSNCKKDLLCTLHFFTYFCRNIFWFLFYFILDVKKCCFDIHFNYITSKCWPQHYPTLSSARFYNYFRPPEGWSSPNRLWSVVHCGASLDSNQFLVPGHIGCWGAQVLSWFRSLALFKWSDGAKQYWANHQNQQPLERSTHIIHNKPFLDRDLSF
jgi:hypothetical protein